MSTSESLTSSRISRQNILNNAYAVSEIQKNVGPCGIRFEGDVYITKSDVASFYGVTTRTIEKIISQYEEELARNGYVVLRGITLKSFKKVFCETTGRELPKRLAQLGLFSFRSFLNIGMLLPGSERASEVRCLMLDIAIDTINVRTGGQTKYINRRDEDFLKALYHEEGYRKEFGEALRDCVAMGQYKYLRFTNRIYVSLFKEKANEYREILKLDARDNERDTFYAEILDLISAYEAGLAAKFREGRQKLGRLLTCEEADEIFDKFESEAHWIPLVTRARQKMASRDFAFRNARHDRLESYIREVDPDDFERFLGTQSKNFERQLEEARETMKRLKERK